MSLRWQLSHGPGAQRDVSARVRAMTTSVRQNAEEGSVAMSTVTVDDPAGDLEIGGLGGFYGYETETPETFGFYSGFIADREVSRGDDSKSFRTTNARQYVVQTADQNSILSRRVLLGTDANRPAETDSQRVNYLLGTPELALLGDDDTYFNSAGGVAMDACDYRGQTCFDVLNDCAQASGKNFWVMYHATGYRLWYDFTSSTEYSSDIRISNINADVDETDAKIAAGTVTTFAASFDTKLVRDPHRVFSGVYMPYDGGAVYERLQSTASNFQSRDTTSYSPNVKSAAKASARALRYLNSIKTEEDRITTTIKVPNAQVNDLMAGHRVECRFSHLPGYEDWSWMRVLNRTVTQVSEYFYNVQVEMSAEPTQTIGGSGSCPLVITGISQNESAMGDGTISAYTPTAPTQFPSIVMAMWGHANGAWENSGATVAVNAPYTELYTWDDPDSHHALAVGYESVASGSSSFSLTQNIAPIRTNGTVAISFPTASTSPVQATSISEGGTIEAVLPGAPTSGNLLVLARACAVGPEADIPLLGAEWTTDGNSFLRLEDNDFLLQFAWRCVIPGEDATINVGGAGLTFWCSLTEWSLTGEVTTTIPSVGGSGPGPVAGGGGTGSGTDPGSSGSVLTLTPSDSVAEFEAAVSNMGYDTIELTSGTYPGGTFTADRTARPLTIRPALGATVNFSRPAAGSAVIAIGYGGTAKYITWDGRAGGVGTTSSMFFKDSTIAKDGFFETYETDHCTYKYLTFQNNVAGTYGGETGGPTTTWCFYIGLQGTTSTNMTIDNCWFKAPAVTRGMGAVQVYASGGGARVDNFAMTNVREMTDYSVAFTAYNADATNITLSNWVMSGVNSYYSDCGGGTSSILFFGSGACSGTYSNIVATSSDPLRDCHSGGGVVSNGGGNSGI